MMADRPHRKPLHGYAPSPVPDLFSNAHSNSKSNSYAHSRTRTTSSNIFPTIQYPPNPPYQQYSTVSSQAYSSRRTPSQGTFTTTGSGGNSPNMNQDLRRSTSSRSTGQPTGYVALMRRQKATVWCDRSQHEDPRIVAQRKAAKMRAAMEVIGGTTQGRLSTSGSGTLATTKSGVTAKIRHHGKSNLVGYTPGDLAGGGVPMRLSATEVEGGDSDDETASVGGSYSRRSGSGRSSQGSKKGLSYRPSGASSIRRGSWSHTPPGEMAEELAEAETPVPTGQAHAKDYFTADGSGDGTRSTDSGSSGERADAVGELGTADAARLASNSLLKSTITREKSTKNPEELRRRGSVDDRTMTLSAGRLYIANPDADSD